MKSPTFQGTRDANQTTIMPCLRGCHTSTKFDKFKGFDRLAPLTFDVLPPPHLGPLKDKKTEFFYGVYEDSASMANKKQLWNLDYDNSPGVVMLYRGWLCWI